MFKIELSVSGDGLFDSSGHCAKHCCYSIMDNKTRKINDFIIVQTGQYTNTGEKDKEKIACRELLKKLLPEY